MGSVANVTEIGYHMRLSRLRRLPDQDNTTGYSFSTSTRHGISRSKQVRSLDALAEPIMLNIHSLIV